LTDICQIDDKKVTFETRFTCMKSAKLIFKFSKVIQQQT